MRRVLLVLALVVGMGACSSGDDGDGDASRPDAGVTTTSTVPGGGGDGEAEATLTSTAFAEGEEIPVEHGGCPPGENVSPDLAWTGLPESTTEVAITLVDPDAGGFVHWAVTGIDPSAGGLAAGEEPPGAVGALNDTGQAGYFGPCPPETHTYVFTVHALEEDPGLTAATSGSDAVAAIEAASVASASLSATFTP